MLSNFAIKNAAVSSIKRQGALRSKSSGIFRTMAQRPIHTAFRASQLLHKPLSAQTDNFVNGTSAVYIDQLYDQWQEDPNSVHASWQAYFSNIENNVAEPFQTPPTLGQTPEEVGQVKVADIL